jgi:hypothetical protein
LTDFTYYLKRIITNMTHRAYILLVALLTLNLIALGVLIVNIVPSSTAGAATAAPVQGAEQELVAPILGEVEPAAGSDSEPACPFTENPGEKGCIPPSDIECNADWTDCRYIGETWQPEPKNEDAVSCRE